MSRCPRFAALLWFLLLSACGSPSVLSGRAVALPVARTVGEPLAPPAQRTDPYQRDIWGNPQVQTNGIVVVAAGTVARRPMRLWFVVPHAIGPGSKVVLRKDQAAQLLLDGGESYISNRVSFVLSIAKDGQTGAIQGHAVEPETDTLGIGELEFEGRVTWQVAHDEQWSRQENPQFWPHTNYVPQRLPYVADQPPPLDYRLERRPRQGLVIAGSIMFGVSYLVPFTIAAASGFANDSGYLAIPLGGAFAFVGANRGTTPEEEVAFAGGVTLALHAALVQAGGLTLLTIGLASTKKSWVRTAPYPIEPASRGANGVASSTDLGLREGGVRLDFSERKLRRFHLQPLLAPSLQGLAVSGRF